METLFDRERSSSSHWVLHCGGGRGEERWRSVHRTFKATLDTNTILSRNSKKKIREGLSLNEALREEIKELAKNIDLEESKRCVKQDIENRGSNNFDKRAFMLQRKLEKLDSSEDAKTISETKEMVETRTGAGVPNSHRKMETPELEVFSSLEKNVTVSDVERLRRSMEEISNGKLKKMEDDFGRMLYITANSAVASSASPPRQCEDPNLPSALLRRKVQDAESGSIRTCSGHCKAVVKRIMDQVRADTEHWTQMQGMLEQVKEEMEELQASRDFWKDRAIRSHSEIKALHTSVQEWRKRAVSFGKEENKLQKQVRMLQRELERLMIEKEGEPEATKSRELRPVSQQLTPSSHDKENRVLTCRVKGRAQSSQNGREKLDGSTERPEKLHHSCGRLQPMNRLPFQDIRNLSPLASQNDTRARFPFHQQY